MRDVLDLFAKLSVSIFPESSLNVPCIQVLHIELKIVISQKINFMYLSGLC